MRKNEVLLNPDREKRTAGVEMKRLLLIAALVVTVGQPACMLGPDFKKPVVDPPDAFRFAGAETVEVVNLKWWELFNDPVLVSLVTTALTNNKDLLVAAHRIEEARASLGFTKADMYPRLDLEAGATTGTFSGGRQADSRQDNFFVAPAVTWEIDFWGKFRRSNEAARAELMASEYSMKTVQISLISEVVGTYFLLLDYHQRLEISEQTLASRLESLDIIEKRFSRGIIPEIDLNQAQIQKEIAAAAIPVHERLISRTENNLSILLGRFPGEIERGLELYSQNIPIDIPAGLPSMLLERRPDIAEARHLVEAQNARIGVAQAMILPAISLTGLLGAASSDLTSFTPAGLAWSAGGNLVGPIFNFKKNIRRVEIERERWQQAVYQYENTVLLAFREVEDALIEVSTYKRQIAAVENKLAAAENAGTLSRVRYDQGVTSFLEVLDTERTLFSVGLELSELRQQFYNAYVRLYKALGGGWLSLEEMEQSQNQPETEETGSSVN